MKRRSRPTQVWIRGRDEEGNLNPALHAYKSGEEWKGNEEGMDPVLVQNTKMRAIILEALALGLKMDRIAQLAGVHTTTLKRWFKEAEEAYTEWEKEYEKTGCLPRLKSNRERRLSLDGRLPFWVQTYYDFEQAKAEGEAESLGIVREVAVGEHDHVERTRQLDKNGNLVGEKVKITSGKRDWRAASWYLERMFPERYDQRRLEEKLPDGIDYETFLIAKVLKSMPKSDLEEVKRLVMKSRQPRLITEDGRRVDYRQQQEEGEGAHEDNGGKT